MRDVVVASSMPSSTGQFPPPPTSRRTLRTGAAPMDLDGRSSRCSHLLDDLEPVAPPIPATPALTSRSRPPEPVHATGEWPSEASRKHVRGSSSEQGTGSACATIGRPREVAPRPCYLCLTPEDADDPIQLPQKDQAGDGVPAGTRLKIKWAYPRVKGMAQGNYCWYCQRTAQAAFPGLALKELSDRVADPRSAERKHFHTCRTRLLEVLAEKGVVVGCGKQHSSDGGGRGDFRVPQQTPGPPGKCSKVQKKKEDR